MSFNTLVSTDVLEQNYNNQDWVIFDCRASLLDHDAGRRAYEKGHIPSALFCDLENDLSSEITDVTGRHPLPDIDTFIERLESWGVTNKSQVIAYDDASGALAVRLWWQLRTLGHTKVAILDGGITQWIKEGRKLNSGVPSSDNTVKTKFNQTIDKQAWLTTEQIEQNLESKLFTVLDARTPERYRGESEPIDPVAGRIPNSLNHAFQLNLNENGMFLTADELRKQFELILNKVPDKSAEKIVHLCGSGVTACHNILAMEIAGLKGSRLYAGSWSEWIRDPHRPVSLG